jgi:hypothetical protein
VRKKKPQTRMVKMKLPLDLIDAIELMAEDGDRHFHGMIVASLKWAAWAHGQGRGPDDETMEDMRIEASEENRRGYSKWNERLVAKRETRELKRLFELGERE